MTLPKNETTYEADPRHVQILVNELGLKDAKEVSTPSVKEKDEEAKPLDAPVASKYRSLTMRASYMVLLRVFRHTLQCKRVCRTHERAN